MQAVGVGGLAEAGREDERHRLRLHLEHLVQRTSGLAQREVERRGVKRPAPPVTVGLEQRLYRKQIQAVHVIAELSQRPASRKVWRSGLLEGELIGGIDDHVLPDSLLASPQQAYDGRQPFAQRHALRQPLEVTGLDLDGQLSQLRKCRHIRSSLSVVIAGLV